MTQEDTWSPYAGSEAVILAVVLLVIAGVLVYLGIRLHRAVGVARPGKVVGGLLVVIWVLSLASFAIAASTYIRALMQQGPLRAPADPITPITDLSGLVTFIAIAYLSRRHGLKTALGSAIVGTAAAPMIFELPFDLIVMGRTYPPTPAVQFTLLFFLPLFLVEVSTFGLVTLSPLAKLSRYTLFSLGAMFLVFAVWAWFGFSYPSHPLPLAFNAISKILSFLAAITLFLPQSRNPNN
jgi:hypothetical protein